MTARPLSPQAHARPKYTILVECCALWGERERSSRLYCRHACHIVAEQHKQDEAVSGALFCDFVASMVSQSWDRESGVCAPVASHSCMCSYGLHVAGYTCIYNNSIQLAEYSA